MPRQAHLADGSVLEFPDNTPDAVMDRAVREHMTQAAPAAPARPAINPAQQQEAQRISRLRIQGRGNNPTRAGEAAYDQTMAPIVSAERNTQALRGQQFMDQVRQIPQINLPRLASDTMTAGKTAWDGFMADPGGSTMRAIGGIPAALDAMTLKPVRENEQAQADEVSALARRDQPALQDAATRTVDTRGQEGINAAGLIAGPLVRGPVSGAALAAGLTLPQSVMAQQGTLQERLPQALVDTAGSMALAAPLGLLGRGAPQGSPRPAAMSSPAERAGIVAEMDRASVPPMAAALQDSGQGTVTAPMTMAIANDPLGGVAVRHRLQQVHAAVQGGRDTIASGYGAPLEPEAAGARLQAGVDAYNAPATPRGMAALRAAAPDFDALMAAPARDWGVRTKAGALYQHVLGPIQDRPATAPATQAFLDGIQGSIDPRPDPLLRDVRDALAGRQNLTLGDLRTLRERVQSAQDFGAMTPDRDARQLSMLSGALTSDMMNAAGDSAANLRRVDQYYSQAMERIDTVLRRIDQRSPAGAFDRIRQWASRGANSQDTNALLVAKRALPHDDWRSIASSTIAHMGDDGHGGFSLTRFANEYDKFSPSGRSVLFGEVGGGGASATQLRAALDDLGQSARRYANIEKMDNFSRTQTHGSALQLGTGAVSAITAMVGHGVTQEAAMGVALLTVGRSLGNAAVGELLTNPRFVRWLAHVPNTPRGVASALPRLASLAARDPQLLPAYNALAHAQGAAGGDQQPQPQSRPQPGPQTERVLERTQ